MVAWAPSDKKKDVASKLPPVIRSDPSLRFTSGVDTLPPEITMSVEGKESPKETSPPEMLMLGDVAPVPLSNTSRPETVPPEMLAVA